ncbi:hypothetical protein C8J57DRAFT_1713148 [Mycena rebaudengoi]|nr:hypothetical protein C8J57DRAFT_1713148 [Mycena rebaudengoi]
MMRLQPRAVLSTGSFRRNSHAPRSWKVSPSIRPYYGTTRATRRPLRQVSTLNPALLRLTDFLDISNHVRFSISFTVRPSGGRGCDLPYAFLQGKRIQFPPHSHGFLYYHSDPKASPMAGSVRLRATTSNTPSSFPQGHDLLLPSGMPWQIILPQIAARRTYTRLRDQLLLEGMATEELLSRCRTVFATRDRIIPEATVFSLHHPFMVYFQQQLSLTIVGPTAAVPVRMDVFNERDSGQVIYPFAGSAVACFERSTLPEHVGNRVLLMRILKILVPVTCTIPNYAGGVGWPKEGEYLMVSRYNRPKSPWSYDVDRDKRVGAVLRSIIDI